jgi:hypothetical protein
MMIKMKYMPGSGLSHSKKLSNTIGRRNSETWFLLKEVKKKRAPFEQAIGLLLTGRCSVF